MSYSINNTDIVAPIRNLYIKSPKPIGVQQLNTLLSDLESLEQLTLTDFLLNDVDQYLVEKVDSHHGMIRQFDRHFLRRLSRDVSTETNVTTVAAAETVTTNTPDIVTGKGDNGNGTTAIIASTESIIELVAKESNESLVEFTTTEPLLDVTEIPEIKVEDFLPDESLINGTHDEVGGNNFEMDIDSHSNDVNTENKPIVMLDDTALSFARILPNLKLLRLKSFVKESAIPNVLFQIIAGLHKLEYLELSSNNLPQIPVDALAFTGSTLKKLYLYKNSIKEINEKAFTNLTELEILDLSHNQLEKIPDYLFKPLKNLQYLSLKSNQFRNLSELTFLANNKLMSLDLSQNFHLQPLPGKLLHGLNNLANFSLAYCNISNVSNHVQQFFRNVPSLSKLDLKGNRITNLTSAGLFAWNHKLNRLDFSSNQIAEISKAIFSTNSSLISEINLDKNRITSLPESLFINARNVRKLSVSANRLSEVSPMTFIQLRLLEEIDLSRNQIRTLNTQVNQLPFGIGTYLRRINLAYNRLANFDSEISSVNWQMYFSLANLDLKHNNFSGVLMVPIFTSSKEHTISLDVSSNHFISVNVKHLLGYRRFKDDPIVNKETHSWETLVRLDNNPIRCDCFLFPFLNYTKSTGRFFDQNYYHSILQKTVFLIDTTNDLMCNEPEPLLGRSLSHLKLDELTCDIDDKRICPTGCHCFYRSVDESAIINCDNSGLEDLPNQLQLSHYFNISLKSTEEKIENVDNVVVQLRNNHISNITGLSRMFLMANQTSSPSFVEIFLDRNNISLIENSFVPEEQQQRRRLPLLRTLSLQDNSIQSVPLSVLKSFENHVSSFENSHNESHFDHKPAEAKLYLSGNPIYCHNEPMAPGSDCYIRELKLWLSSHHNLVGDANQIQCENLTIEPERLKESESNLVLVNMSDDILCPVLIPPQDNTIMMALSLICIVLASSLFVVSILYYRNKQTILAFIYIHLNPVFICLSFTEDDLDEDKIYDAFVSYSSSDRDIVMELIEKLEKPQDMSEVSLILQNGASIHEGKVDQIVPENEFKKTSTLKSSKDLKDVEGGVDEDSQYRLCIHERDWLPGNLISWNIVNSVQNSKRTILILSQSFIQSIWFQVEFHTAYYQMLEDKMDRLIVIVRGELPPKDQLDKDLNFLLTTKTYLVWGEKWFWEKLYYAMPHKKRQKTKDASFVKSNLSGISNGKSGANGAINGVNYKDGMLKWSSTYSSPKNGKAEAMKDYVDKTIASHFQLNSLSPSPMLNAAIQQQPNESNGSAVKSGPKSLRNSGTLATATPSTLQAFQRNASGGYENASFINETNT